MYTYISYLIYFKVGGPKCYSCSNIADPSQCTQTTQCHVDEVRYQSLLANISTNRCGMITNEATFPQRLNDINYSTHRSSYDLADLSKPLTHFMMYEHDIQLPTTTANFGLFT